MFFRAKARIVGWTYPLDLRNPSPVVFPVKSGIVLPANPTTVSPVKPGDFPKVAAEAACARAF